jgi:hypothetical protein
MNSPLQRHKVRLRGLGGPAVKAFRATARPQPESAVQIGKQHNSPLEIRETRLLARP